MSETLIVTPLPYLQIPVFSAMSGYSDKAVRRKIEEGVWLEGREYIKAPDGHILISIKGYSQWVERGWASKSANDPSVSRLPTKASQSAARSS